MASKTESEVIYEALCDGIGTEQHILYRREIVEIIEKLTNEVRKSYQKKILWNGSRREGFRSWGSDIDFMYWFDRNRVIWEFSKSQFYKEHTHTMIFCDDSESPPGYTLLWLPSLRNADSNIISASEQKRERSYISSSKYRQITCSLYRPGSKIHGPCSSGTLGDLEYDEAHCFASDYWPPSAYHWIERCHSWPQRHIRDNIISAGCHFVAIGHKDGNHADNEWRISFSQAENNIVYSMNQTQFLTYGLLKTILKEVLNDGLKDENKLLSSYHIKTVVFWAIQQNTLHNWCPQSMLDGFLICYKVLLRCIYEGVCPNFFIPQNNMFLGKINGSAQSELFDRLYEYYDTEITNLLRRCSFLKPYFDILSQGIEIFEINESPIQSEIMFDELFFYEIENNDAYLLNLQNFVKAEHIVEQMIFSHQSKYQIAMLQKLSASILQRIAFLLSNMYSSKCLNRHIYIVDKISCQMLRLAAKFGYVSDILYIAIYYYKSFRYKKAASILKLAKVKLAKPYIMYSGNVNSQESYVKAVGGKSLSTKMSKAIAQDIALDNTVCYIDELIPEQRSSKQNGANTLFIPPFVLLYMLELFCSKHINKTRKQSILENHTIVHQGESILEDLHTIVHEGKSIPQLCKDISWDILGICQHFVGNREAALYSFKQSLRQDSFHKINTATKQRIDDLHFSE